MSAPQAASKLMATLFAAVSTSINRYQAGSGSQCRQIAHRFAHGKPGPASAPPPPLAPGAKKIHHPHYVPLPSLLHNMLATAKENTAERQPSWAASSLKTQINKIGHMAENKIRLLCQHQSGRNHAHPTAAVAVPAARAEAISRRLSPTISVFSGCRCKSSSALARAGCGLWRLVSSGVTTTAIYVQIK